MATAPTQSVDVAALLAMPSATFTIDRYDQMIAAGVFAGQYEHNIELLWGKIVEMPPIGPPHETATDKLTKWSIVATLNAPVTVRVQNSIRLRINASAPQPDICWVEEKDYSVDPPQADDVLLVIEVADTSLARDRGEKLAAYAQAGIPDYWIVDVVNKQIEIYREPNGLLYERRMVCGAGEKISPLALPEAVLDARELFASSPS
jgi:Uma2 family endonuclease